MRRLLLTLGGLYPRVELAFTAVGAWIIIALMLFTTGTVLSRYLLNKPFRGAMDFTELALPAIVFLGLAYTQKRGQHLHVGLLVDNLRGRQKYALQTIGKIITLFFFVMVFWYGWEYAWRALSMGGSTVQGYPTWPSKIMLPLGSAFICIRLSLQLVATLKYFWSGESDSS
ncbi:TRAP transporter small permease [Chloroflexota bacterium]